MSYENLVQRDARIKARMDARAQRLGQEANETKGVARDWKRMMAAASESGVAVIGTSAVVGVDSYSQVKAESGPRNSDLGDAVLVTLALATTAIGPLVDKFGDKLSPRMRKNLKTGSYMTAAALVLAACAPDGALPTVGVTYVPETPTVSAPLPTVTQEVPTVAVATATPVPTEIPTLEPTRPAPFSAELIAQGGEGQNSILTYNSNDEVIKQLESQGELFFRRIADGAVGARVCPTPGGTCYISAAYPTEIAGLGRVVSTAGGVVRYSNGYIFVPTFPDAINGARFLGVALKNGVLTGEYVKPDGSLYSEAGHTVAGNEQSVVTKPDLFTTVVDGQTFYAGKEVGEMSIPGFQEAMVETMGAEYPGKYLQWNERWKKWDFLYVIDGTLERNVPIPGTDAVAAVAVRGHYAVDGVDKEILIAKYIRLSSGLGFSPGFMPDNLTDDQIEKILSEGGTEFHLNIPFRVMGAAIVSDLDVDCALNLNAGGSCLPYLDFLKQYQNANKDKIDDLVRLGDNSLQILVPVYQSGTGIILELPDLQGE